jgi:hypothetical protein
MPEGYSHAAMWLFEAAFLPWMRRRVDLRMTGLPRDLPSRTPLVIASNHSTWWDGFALRALQRSLRPRAPVYTVMLERELARRPFFRRIGVIGIDPERLASVRGLMRRIDDLTLRRPDSVIIFFPQGRIWPSYRRPLGFRPGIELLLRQLPEWLLLPVGLHLESLNSSRPTLFLNCGAVQSSSDPPVGAGQIEACVEKCLDDLRAHLLRCGEDAARLWPGPHQRLEPSGMELSG